MHKNKKAKRVVCFLLIIAISVFYFLLVAPKLYVAKKYDLPIYSVKLEKISLPYINFKGEVTPDEKINMVSDLFFIFKFNDKKFVVDNYKFSYYDDYQLEEIAEWTTEYFQNNVDENICGIQIAGEGVAINEGKHTLLKQYINKKDVLKYFLIDEKYSSISLFYYVDDLKNLDKKSKQYVANKLKEKFKKTVNNNDYSCRNIHVYFIDDKEKLIKRYDEYVDKEGNKYLLHNSYFGMDRYEFFHYNTENKIEIYV